VDKDDLIYKTKSAKLKAIAEEIKKYHDKGQPVLVGSGSIANNEEIARYLEQFGLPYEILNAKNNSTKGRRALRSTALIMFKNTIGFSYKK
jgi:preprotein translocase subunit SecA